jgi:hypothetical protein
VWSLGSRCSDEWSLYDRSDNGSSCCCDEIVAGAAAGAAFVVSFSYNRDVEAVLGVEQIGSMVFFWIPMETPCHGESS